MGYPEETSSKDDVTNTTNGACDNSDSYLIETSADTLQDFFVQLENEASNVVTVTPIDMSQEVVMIVGNTRSGKTTLRKLLSSCHVNFENLEVVGEPPRIDGDEIGDTSGSSCTTGPIVFQLPSAPHLTFVDTPGGHDNRGFFQEIMGMHLLNKVSNQAKRLKLLIVIPFQAFYDEGDKMHRVQPFQFAMQLISHVSNADCVGLVVTKVENHGPWNDDAFVKNKVLSTLETLKLQCPDGKQISLLSMKSVLQSIINRSSVFLVRRPLKAIGIQSIPVAEVLDPITNLSFYGTMCNNFTSFCDKLKSAQKLSDFSITPSAATRNALLEDIYPGIVKKIEQSVDEILSNLQQVIREQVNVLSGDSNAGKVKVLSRLVDALENVSRFCTSSAQDDHASEILENIGNIFQGDDVISSQLSVLKRLGKQFRYLQSITGVPHASRIMPNVLNFQRDLDAMYKKLMFQNNAGLKSELEEWVRNEVQNQVCALHKKYMDRFNVWTKKENYLHLLAVNKLNYHLSCLRKIKEDNRGETISTFDLMYDAVKLAITETERDAFHQLNLTHKNLDNIGGGDHSAGLEGPVEQMSRFLEERKDRVINETENWGKEIFEITKTEIVRILGQVEQALLSEFYKGLDLEQIPMKLCILISMQERIGSYLQLYSERRNGTGRTFTNELYEFLRHLELSLKVNADYFSYLEEDDEEKCFSIWQDAVIGLCGHFRNLKMWYEFMEELMKISNESALAYQELRKLDNFSLSWNEKLAFIASLASSMEGFPSPPECVNEMTTQPERYSLERKIFQDFANKLGVVPTTLPLGNSLFIISEHHILLSDFVDSDGHLKILDFPDGNPAYEWVVFLSSGPMFVDTDFIAAEESVNNLLILCSNVKCSGDVSIKLKGRVGSSIPGRAPPGTSPGMKGEDGAMGRPGGTGGNIYLLSQQTLNFPSLSLISEGGDGGRGQNGGKGHCGTDELMTTRFQCMRLQSCFTEFDKLLEAFCKHIGYQLPNLEDYQLNNDDTTVSPNHQIFQKTKHRVLTFLVCCATIGRIVDTVPSHIPSEDESPCFCSDLLYIQSQEHFIAPEHFGGPLIPDMSKPSSCPAIVAGDSICLVYSFLLSPERLKLVEKWGVHPEQILSWYSPMYCEFRDLKDFQSEPTGKLFTIMKAICYRFRKLCELVVEGDIVQNIKETNFSAIFDLETKCRNPQSWILFNYMAYTGYGPIIAAGAVLGSAASVLYSSRSLRENKEASEGGAGGRGGDGGVPGCPGQIRVYNGGMNSDLKIKVQTKHGLVGECGLGGEGGRNGATGSYNFGTGSRSASAGESGQRNSSKCCGICNKSESHRWELEVRDTLLPYGKSPLD